MAQSASSNGFIIKNAQGKYLTAFGAVDSAAEAFIYKTRKQAVEKVEGKEKYGKETGFEIIPVTLTVSF